MSEQELTQEEIQSAEKRIDAAQEHPNGEEASNAE